MTSETSETGLATSDIRHQAAQHTLAANPLVGVRSQDIIDAASMLLAQMARNPWAATRRYLSFLSELGRIATGGSELAVDDKDRRFADPAWQDSAAYRALAQCYLAWGHALDRLVDDVEMDRRDAARALRRRAARGRAVANQFSGRESHGA
jgi:polyhydroxyalkanoate synthase